MAGRKQALTQANQELLPFSAQVNERLAEIRSLDRVLGHMHPARSRGVIELLERIVLLSQDGETSHARVSVLAARIQTMKSVNERTIRRWAQDAKELGVLCTDERSHRYGGHYPNVWKINRVRLQELLGRTGSANEGAGAGRTWGGHGAGGMPAPGADVVPALTEARDVANFGSERIGAGTEKETIHGDQAEAARTTRRRDPPALDRLRSELVEHHPLLRDAYLRRVAPLPPGELIGDSFAPLSDDTFCERNLFRLIRWFRCHLGVREPLLCDTEADLLIVLAAGYYAISVPSHEVKTTRRRIFAYTISRADWRRCCRYFASASELLARFLVVFPQALSHPESMGPRAVDVAQTQEAL